MAVPKKKTSKAKSRSRRASAWVLERPSRSLCPRCGATKVPHVVCGNCGWYNNRQAVEIDWPELLLAPGVGSLLPPLVRLTGRRSRPSPQVFGRAS